MDKRGDIAAQVQQCMQFYRRLGTSKVRPGEHGQAQVDGGGVECVDRVVEFDAEAVPRAVCIRDWAKSA